MLTKQFQGCQLGVPKGIEGVGKKKTGGTGIIDENVAHVQKKSISNFLINPKRAWRRDVVVVEKIDIH